MEQHPIPRQITSFEFKLIGFMTLKQFIYLVVAFPIGFLVFKLFPIPIVNILLGVICVVIGLALAFVPINDRPLDLWIKNLMRRITSATQYVYHKENAPIYFLQKLFFVSDPHQVFAHVESEEKLEAYLAQQKTKQNDANAAQAAHKKEIGKILRNPPASAKKPSQTSTNTAVAGAPAQQQVVAPKKPALVGVVKNSKKIPLPGLLIYMKDQTNKPVRLLKTNPHGIFATYSTIPPGEYSFEIKDPKGSLLFDTMKMKIDQGQPLAPLEFYSKELM